MIPPAPPLERLLLEFAEKLPGGRLLCNTAGRGQFAGTYAKLHPDASVTCWFLDLYQLEQSRRSIGAGESNLRLVCESDPPNENCDLVVWSFSRQGNSELAREMLQVGHQRLVDGGQLVAAVDNPSDQWLHERMRELFRKLTRQTGAAGVLYQGIKTGPLKKLKNYAAEFAFRDAERLIYLRTRPGVFSHRELDGGARALIKSLVISPGMRVLDLGCGSGAVALAAASRATGGQVDAVDSNPRAVEATRWAAERNMAPSVRAALDCDGSTIQTAAYDLVVTNPPYYSDFRIPTLFLNIAARAIRSGGTLMLVTKSPQWYADHWPIDFAEATLKTVGNYVVLSARRV